MSEILSLPEGNRRGGNCGITAVAILAKVPFDTVWYYLKVGKRRWVGGTTNTEQQKALTHFGVKFEELPNLRGQPMLKDWIRYNSKPGITYLVTTKRHVQVVKDGMVIDQKGLNPIHEYWGRSKHVTRVLKILA